MGQDATAKICYGILVDEETELPWQDEDGDDDIDAWWRKECGYQEPFPLYNPDGNGYVAGIELVTDRWGRQTPADETLTSRYFAHGREWDKSHPLPVDEVNMSTYDDPTLVLAVPGTIKTARWGSPVEIDPDSFHWNDHALAAFLEFCEKYGVAGEGPKWWLGAFWG